MNIIMAIIVSIIVTVAEEAYGLSFAQTWWLLAMLAVAWAIIDGPRKRRLEKGGKK